MTSSFFDEPKRPYDFNCVPQIRRRLPSDTSEFETLLPNTGGIPGYVYAQMPITAQRDAEMDTTVATNGSPGWQKVDNIPTYTIRGPKGDIDMVLMVSGKRIIGESPGLSEQICLIDDRVYEATGIEDPGDYKPRVDQTPREVSLNPAPALQAVAVSGPSDEVLSLRAELEEVKSLLSQVIERETAPDEPEKKRRGRPPGSKNKTGPEAAA